VTTRTLTFASTFNFRDVGGYPGLGGRSVRWRRLFRSDSLHRLHGEDLEAFGELGVRTVIDLRRAHEVERIGRVPEVEGLEYHNPVIEHIDWAGVEEPADMPHARWLADRYLNFTVDGTEGIRTSLALLADPEAAPAVVHCMAGKDRTGVVCALTLSLLGVSDEDVAEDYALTESSMSSLTEYLLRTNPDAVSDKYHMFTCPRDAMSIFLDDLRAAHGSVEGYVTSIGITGQQVAALRDHLLE
jgi:protein-tyrosine phosphatase